MTKTLDVYLLDDLVGQLIQNDVGDLQFSYGESWLNTPDARPLSQSLPLRAEPYTRRDAQAFFGGILPEETVRERVAKKLGITPRNDYRMLEAIGGEVAGAITLLPQGAPPPNRAGAYRELSEEDLVDVLARLPERPLMAGEAGIRLSLAGAQDKLAVHYDGHRLALPLEGAPSTHILKPASPTYPSLHHNEAFCMRLASAIGLNAAEVSLGKAGSHEYLLITRYDRVHDSGGLARLHQEDFCQALGILSTEKYQVEGGPTLKACFDLLRAVSSLPVFDLQALLDGVLFNLIIVNNDAHGKNFSLLYNEGTRLAPLYDLICTQVFPGLSERMAMKLGGQYSLDDLYRRHYERFADDARLSKPLVIKRLEELIDLILKQIKDVPQTHDICADIIDVVESRSQLIRARLKV